MKNLKVALDYLYMALERAPSDPSIIYTIGYAYEINSNLKMAKEWYSKGLLVAPNSKLLEDSLLRVSK